MATLDKHTSDTINKGRLVGLESRVIQLLENHNPNASTGAIQNEYERFILEYVKIKDSVLEMDLDFIFKLIKRAIHSVTPDLEDALSERLLQFSDEGIYLTDNAGSRYTSDKLFFYKSNFFSFKGELARVKFQKTGDINWAVNVYDWKRKSAVLTQESQPEYSANDYQAAGGAAREILINFRKSGDFSNEDLIHWAEKMFDSYSLASQTIEKSGPKSYAHANTYAGKAASILYIKTRKSIWKERAIECYENFLNFYESHFDVTMTPLVIVIRNYIDNLNRNKPRQLKINYFLS